MRKSSASLCRRGAQEDEGQDHAMRLDSSDGILRFSVDAAIAVQCMSAVDDLTAFPFSSRSSFLPVFLALCKSKTIRPPLI